MHAHRARPAEAGTSRPDVPPDRTRRAERPRAPAADDSIRGPRAHLLGSEEPAGDEVRQEARRHRHRPDHAGGRLRVREPRDARRALEGGLVPLPDAGFPRARAPRRELRHRRRSLRDRIVARDEPGRPQGRRRGSRARRWSSSAATTWATSSGATASTSACTSCRAPKRSPTRGTATSSRFDPRDARSSRNETQGKTYEPVPAVAQGRGDPPQRRHLRGRPARVPASRC